MTVGDNNKTNMKIARNKPLNKLDKEDQTYGCRYNNPDTCAKNSMPGVCAFVCKDGICRHPPRSWKRLYHKLLEESGAPSI